MNTEKTTSTNNTPEKRTEGGSRPPVRSPQTGNRTSGPQNPNRRRGGLGRGPSASNGGQSRGGNGGGRGRRPSSGGRRPAPRGGQGRISIPSRTKENTAPIPPIQKGNIRIIPLGGVEEIGKNMTVIETYEDIFIIDAGFQFRDEKTPGIDYILPNTKYLEDRKDKIRGLFVTHGHLDHVGGIPYVMKNIGNPPIYSRNLTTIMIKKRQEEFPHMPTLNIKIVEKDERIAVGSTHVRFFAVTHTIPDAMGVVIETPYGDIVGTGDLKLEHVDGVPTESEEKEFAKFKDKNTLMLMMDSTNVEQPGFSLSETVVFENIKKIITEVKGRLIVGTFASLIERLVKIIEYAEETNKKVVVDGRSMKNNIEIAQMAGIFKVKKGTIIGIDEMDNYPPDRIVVLATGAQGDEFASLMRASNKSHKYLKLTPRDTVLLSSSIVPGNERSVQRLKDNIARQGVKIIHYRIAEVHSSGHANSEETAWIHRKIAPKFFMPIHGHHHMLRVHEELAKRMGLAQENIIVPDNGMIIEIQENGQKLVKLAEKAASNVIMVDGFSVGDIQDVVIRDRQMLAQDGMFVVVAIVDSKTGKVKKSPDIISRGFVYLRESQELLREARFLTKKTIERGSGAGTPDFDTIKGQISDQLGRFLLQQTAKRPIILPVLIGV